MSTPRFSTPALGTTSLRDLPLLRDLPTDELDRLWRAGRPCEVQKGAALVRQGEPALHLHLVVRGRFKAWVEESGREPSPVSDVFPGELVGDAALFRGPRGEPPPVRTATLIAWEPSLSLAFEPEALAELRETAALMRLQQVALMALARRVRTTEHALRRLSGEATPQNTPEPGLWGRLRALLGALG